MANLEKPIESEMLKVAHELKKHSSCDTDGPILYDCIVCLCEVKPQDDGMEKLPNCNHEVQFHLGCIELWLKDQSTCPLCRSHVPQHVHQRLNACLYKIRDDIVSYCHIALENVASSIGDCHDS